MRVGPVWRFPQVVLWKPQTIWCVVGWAQVTEQGPPVCTTCLWEKMHFWVCNRSNTHGRRCHLWCLGELGHFSTDIPEYIWVQLWIHFHACKPSWKSTQSTLDQLWIRTPQDGSCPAKSLLLCKSLKNVNLYYQKNIDANMTFNQNDAIPVTFTCDWGEKAGLTSLREHPKIRKTKGVAYVASNCGYGGADARTRYVEELMKYIKVDSYGM